MQNGERKRVHKGLKITLIAIVAIIIGAVLCFAVYVGDYYHADAIAEEAYIDGGSYASDDIKVEGLDGKIAFVPPSARAGFVFYPGAKVDPTAYAPLMQDLAQEGVLCVICPMPFNLAIFDPAAAAGVQRLFPQVETWYIGGHSLGGSIAASYLAEHPHDFAGLILLASYSIEDLSDTGDAIISIRGSNDQVLNAFEYNQNAHNIQGSSEVIIEGGNHAFFGSYGQQAGDGEATIMPSEQWEQTARAISAWMK